MEGRLDNLLSRIAMETQEIKELEQQLTDSQILANEALQMDLKEVICGLQEYLSGLRQQARGSQRQADVLQAENQRLQRLLEETQSTCRQQDGQQVELSALWVEVQTLRSRQAELEAELLRQREELTTCKEAPGSASPGTRDSGLGLQYLCSPDRGRQQDGPPAGQPHWVYVPSTHTHRERECVCSERQNDGVLSDSSSRRGGPLPPSPDPAAAQTSLLGLARLLCGRPAGGAAPYCNIPEHQEGRCVSECVHEDDERLKEEKKKKKQLRTETKQLRLKLKQHRCVTQVCDDVKCLEETLLKRRAELREADRLLLRAQSHRHTTCRQVHVLLLSLEDVTRRLRELKMKKEEEEQTLREVEEVLRSRHQELKQLGTKTQTAANRLDNVLSECQEAQWHLDSLTCQEELEEQRLVRRKEEHQTTLDRVEELREEEQRLQRSIKDLLNQQEALLTWKRP